MLHKTFAWALAALGTTGAASAQSLLFEKYGNSPDDQLGTAVDGGADIDLDGFDDIVVGAPFKDSNGLTDNGLVRVISGQDGTTLFVARGDASDDHFGWSVAIAGDVNDDGWPDIVAGAPNGEDGGLRPGMARVISGFDGSTLYTLYGDVDGDEFGYSVTGHLDRDGDAFADFAVGAPNGDSNPLFAIFPGYDRVFAGATGSALQTQTSVFDFARWGESLCGEGDANGDGVNDLVIGVPAGGTNDAGEVKVVNGATGGVMWTANGDSAGDRFGAAVGSRLDPDGDGSDEVLAGAPDDDDGGTDAGSVRMLDGLNGTEVTTWHGEAAFDRLGTSLASCVDLDDDGRRDVLAGAPQEIAGGLGLVYVFGSGSEAEILRLSGDPGSRFGRSVGPAGDFNGDGTPDIVAGGNLADDPEEPLNVDGGLVRVLSGGAPGFVNYCTAGVSASGCQALISGLGLPSATAASGFVLSAVDVEGSKTGLFFYGANGRQANSWGNTTSFQCVVPPVKRGGQLPAAGTNGNCDGSFSQDLNARWCPTCPNPSHNFGAGAVVQAQLWYRDPLSGTNQLTSLSDAIEFVIAP
jgi:hypothetical protein